MLRLFFYGTLKRGFWNHDRFCRGVLAVEDAVVCGRLFETPSGIHVLLVPEEDILDVGTTHPLADVATQARFAVETPGPWLKHPVLLQKNATGAPWGPVYRELLTFDDPETCLFSQKYQYVTSDPYDPASEQGKSDTPNRGDEAIQQHTTAPWESFLL